MGKTIKILLIEDNPREALFIEEMLNGSGLNRFEIVNAKELSHVFDLLDEPSFDVILLGFNLPESFRKETTKSFHLRAPSVPIVVLSGISDEELGARAVKDGAQDYLIKGEIDGLKLARSIRYAIERQALRTELITLSLIDELTGLHNRRSFMALAAQHLHLARRMNSRFLILFADVDNLKDINDNFGHHAGDEALIRIADIFRRTFRKSDIIARMGGDEFIVLASSTSHANIADITKRLFTNIDKANSEQHMPFKLSISLGMARYDNEKSQTVEDLIREADAALYQDKRSKRLGQ